jgi:hypothetical protein
VEAWIRGLRLYLIDQSSKGITVISGSATSGLATKRKSPKIVTPAAPIDLSIGNCWSHNGDQTSPSRSATVNLFFAAARDKTVWARPKPQRDRQASVIRMRRLGGRIERLSTAYREWLYNR